MTTAPKQAQRTPGPYRVKREGQSHHVVVGFDRMPVYETTRLELARRECRRLNAEAARDTLANPKFAAAVAAAMNPQETIKALREQNADLVAALRDATAYVELFTDKGVREQPSADVRLPNGDFDAEQIAFNGRAALAKAQS